MRSKRYLLILIVFITVLFELLTCVGLSLSFVSAKSVYSNVLDDLHRDKSFVESNYPIVDNDYSLNLIQLAESADNELFVYVYQPSGANDDVVVSSINISTTINDYVSYQNYKLTLVSSSGSLFKYCVSDFKVKQENARYYVITSIYRVFSEKLGDKQAEDGNVIAEVDFNVSKQYCFSSINGQPYCSVVDVDTIVVTDKFVGFCRYSDGFKLYVGACDSHFVAFNTDRRMDKLLEADVYYTSQKYSYSFVPIAGEDETYGDKSDQYSYLKYKDHVDHTGDGWFAGTYKWDRIETVEQFFEENDVTQNVYAGALIDVSVANKITDKGIAALKGKKWVLRFAETPFSMNTGSGMVTKFSTVVGDVSILRLKFETDGITYNLGVLDNKQTGSDDPINDEETIVTVSNGLPWWAILILVVLALIIIGVLCFMFKPVWLIVKWILLAVWYIVSAPFRFIAWIVKKCKKEE